MTSEDTEATSPKMQYKEYLKNMEEGDPIIETLYKEDQVSQRFLKWNNITSSKEVKDLNNAVSLETELKQAPRLNNKDVRVLDPLYCDENWQYFIETLDFFYPPKDRRKYYIAIRPISSYRMKPKTTVILGEYAEKFIISYFISNLNLELLKLELLFKEL